jgi:hypothetical protein
MRRQEVEEPGAADLELVLTQARRGSQAVGAALDSAALVPTDSQGRRLTRAEEGVVAVPLAFPSCFLQWRERQLARVEAQTETEVTGPVGWCGVQARPIRATFPLCPVAMLEADVVLSLISRKSSGLVSQYLIFFLFAFHLE